jgi:hypothetical protein
VWLNNALPARLEIAPAGENARPKPWMSASLTGICFSSAIRYNATQNRISSLEVPLARMPGLKGEAGDADLSAKSGAVPQL